MPNLIATRVVRYGGRDRQVNEQFEVPDKDARTLLAIGKARLADAPPAPVEEDEPDPKPKSGAYKRRDLQAEGVKEEEAAPRKAVGRTGPAGKAKRSRS